MCRYFLQRNGLLARRLLKKELEPSVVLNMSPNELKVRALTLVASVAHVDFRAYVVFIFHLFSVDL